MVCCMLGSCIFSMAIKTMSVEQLPTLIHGLAVAANLGVVLFIQSKTIVYLSFLAFEVACGIFYPAYGTLRSMCVRPAPPPATTAPLIARRSYIPESNRAAVMNFFRVPLNAFVILVLLKVKFMPVETVFTICSAAHAVGLLCFMAFQAEIKSRRGVRVVS